VNGHPPLDTHRLSEHARANRTYWNEESDAYQERNGPMLKASSGLGWGVWQIPEAQLQVLGNVRDKDVLELGCGAAQWSIALSQLGARPVGLDISEQQLAHARRLMEEAGVDFPLLHASAEEVPLPDASFDIIFCDWGATSFCDPYLYMREVERLLRPAGIFAFSGSTPFCELCWKPPMEIQGDRLLRDYFDLHRIDWEDGTAEFMLTYGDWVRLFRRHSFEVEDLIELRPAADAVSTYVTDEEREWCRRWPREQIWKVRKKA